MDIRKLAICIFAFAMAFSVGTGSSHAGEIMQTEIYPSWVYLDVDGDGIEESVLEEEGRVVVDGMEFEIEGRLHKVFRMDFTGDGNDEILVAAKENGSSANLSYKVYSLDGSDKMVVFERSGLYRGVLEVEGESIIEKIPVYEEGDSNSSPSMLEKSVYSFSEGGFKLESDSIEEPEEKRQALASSYYTNPPRSEIEDVIEEVALERGIPPVILKAIAFTESGLRQFDRGMPLESFDGVSYGIMQVTPGVHSNYDAARLKYDMRYNIEAGAQILLSKWGYAFRSSPVIPKIGDGDPRKLENWYFAVWAYNGWSQSNNPNMIPYDHSTWVQRVAYQDKVLSYAQSEFGQKITPIDPDTLPAEGRPDPCGHFETPSPVHRIGIAPHSNGDVIASSAQSGLVLRDSSWNSIGGVLKGEGMYVIGSPVLHGGYLRYPVRIIGKDSSGWVAMNWTKKTGRTSAYGMELDSMEDVAAIKSGMGCAYDGEFDINGDGKIDSNDVLTAGYMLRLRQDDRFDKIRGEGGKVSWEKTWTVEFTERIHQGQKLEDIVYITDKWGRKTGAEVEIYSGRRVRIYPPAGGYGEGEYRMCVQADVESESGETLESGSIMEFEVK